MIVLDWTRPWTFIDQLQTWIAWVERWVKGDGARELEVIREEGRERRAYSSPLHRPHFREFYYLSNCLMYAIAETRALQFRRTYNTTQNPMLQAPQIHWHNPPPH